MLPRDMFYATDISVTLWLCGNHKKAKKVRRNGTEVMLRNRENETLFIDARTLGDGGNNDDGYTLLTEADKERIANTILLGSRLKKIPCTMMFQNFAILLRMRKLNAIRLIWHHQNTLSLLTIVQ